MSVREVTQLRKAGKYKEALVLAIQDLNNQDDEWTQMSLFWCLYSYCKDVLVPRNDTETSKKCLLKMEELLPTMKDDNGLGQKCCQNLRSQLLPHADVIKRCAEMGKTNPEQAYEELSQLPLAEIDSGLHNDYGWVIYRYLKTKVAANPTSSELNEINQLLNVFLSLHCERPSLLHSLVLLCAIKYAKKNEDFDFKVFFGSWGPENLREEDWVSKSALGNDGKMHEFKSVAKECADLCFKSIKPADNREHLGWIKEFYEKVWHRNPSDENCMRNYARLCLLFGDVATARDLYAKIVLQAGNKYYVWYEYAGLVDDNKIKIGLLLKARLVETNEDYIGQVHLALAETFIEQKFYSQATKELEALSNHYQEKRWRMPREYYEFKRLCEGKEDSEEFRRGYYLGLAEDFVYSSLPPRFGVIDYVNKEKRVLHIIDTESNLLFHKYTKTNLRAGDEVTFRITTGNKADKPRVIAVKKVKDSEVLTKSRNFKVIVGTLRLEKRKNTKHNAIRKTNKPLDSTEADFGYVDNCYVYKTVLSRCAVVDGCTVIAKAVVRTDGKWSVYDIKRKE